MLDEINKQIEDVQSLIKIRTGGLQKLREQAARYGMAVPLPVQNEIEMFEQELGKLNKNLAQLQREKAALSAPLVYMHTFGTPETSLLPGTLCLKWGTEFDREVSPRRISEPEVWELKLLPELKCLRDETIRQKGLIRLQGTIALTAGFAFGSCFSRAGQYQLSVKQGPVEWRSDAAEDATEPNFKEERFLGTPGAADIAVLVNALKDQDSNDLVEDALGYLSKKGGVQELLLLEAEEVTRQKKIMEGWQAAVLARNSLAVVRKFARPHAAHTLHVFLATPAGLAIFLGHQWNAVGITAQLHEFAGGVDKYTPSCRLMLT